MQIALISDLHANASALSVLLPHLQRADRVVCLGDLVGYYCQVNETIELLRELNPLCVLGNHDLFLLRGCPTDVSPAVSWSIDYADRVISASHRRYLSGLPQVWGGEIGSHTYLFSHGSPWRPMNDYLYRDRVDLVALRQFAFDVIAFGQTHRPWLDAEPRPVVVNVGSVGQSRHTEAVACATLIDSETFEFQQIEVPYDPGPVIEQALAEGAGEWIWKHLVPAAGSR